MSELNPNLREHLGALQVKAAVKGVNLWDVLHAAGLLFTEDMRRNHRAHALHLAIEALKSRSMPQLLGDAYVENRATAKDARRSIIEFLEGRYELEKQGGAP